MRKDYGFIRNWLSFFTPMFFVVVVPKLLGITTPKPEFETFRFVLDFVVSWCFFGGLAYLIYALWFNARLEQEMEFDNGKN